MEDARDSPALDEGSFTRPSKALDRDRQCSSLKVSSECRAFTILIVYSDPKIPRVIYDGISFPHRKPSRRSSPWLIQRLDRQKRLTCLA